MQIERKHLLFSRFENNGEVYSCMIKESLQKGLCIKEKGRDGFYFFVSPFPQNSHTKPWQLTHSNKDTFEIDESSYIKYKVFSMQEITFMREYLNIKKDVPITIPFLMGISKGYDRCSFVVTADVFADILGRLDILSGQYKHCSLVFNGTFKEMAPSNNQAYIVSLYDLNNIFTNVYRSAFSGVGVAFEVVDINDILKYKSPYVQTAYTIFTNDYEGIFYRDGKDRILEKGIDFYGTYSHFSSRLEKYERQRKEYLSLNKDDIILENRKATKVSKTQSCSNMYGNFSDIVSPRAKVESGTKGMTAKYKEPISSQSKQKPVKKNSNPPEAKAVPPPWATFEINISESEVAMMDSYFEDDYDEYKKSITPAPAPAISKSKDIMEDFYTEDLSVGSADSVMYKGKKVPTIALEKMQNVQIDAANEYLQVAATKELLGLQTASIENLWENIEKAGQAVKWQTVDKPKKASTLASVSTANYNYYTVNTSGATGYF